MSPITCSIIIPAYNEEKNLQACLDSIRCLDYPREDFEVIVVDNGSSDRTREIGASHGAKLLVDNRRNVSGLRNLGASKARGEILVFIDADCVASRDWLKNASPYFAQEDVAAWGAPPGLPEEVTWVQRTWYIVRRKEKSVQDVGWLESMNLFVRRRQFLSIGGFNEDLVTCEDADFCFRMAKQGRIVADSRIAVVHLGEAATVKEFMMKEIWRGRGNLRGLLSHGLLWRELPSLCVPVYFGAVIPLLLIGAVFTLNLKMLLLFVLLYLLPGALVLFRVRKKTPGMGDAFRLLFLLQVYFLARTVAVFRTGG